MIEFLADLGTWFVEDGRWLATTESFRVPSSISGSPFSP